MGVLGTRCEASDLDRLSPLPPDQLFRQWRLTDQPCAVPVGWSRETLGDWTLDLHPDARPARLLSRSGGQVGWLLGALVRLGQHDDGPVGETLQIDTDDAPDAASLDRALYGRGADGLTDGTGIEGHWTALIVGAAGTSDEPAVYLAAANSVLYHAESRTVAPSHNLIQGLRRDVALSEMVDPIRNRQSYAFGLTAYEGLVRLLPNHKLCLRTFAARRHWPNASIAPSFGCDEAAVRIVDHARRVLAAATQGWGKVQHSLSAGRDSRAILAIARPAIEAGSAAFSTRTSVGRDVRSKIDGVVARQLARRAGIPHDVTQADAAQPSDRAVLESFIRCGEAFGGGSLVVAARAVEAGDEGRDGVIALPGMAGETARSYYWHEGAGLAADAISPERLARLTGLPSSPAVLAAIEAWFGSLPTAWRDRPEDVLDLAYVEQRLGSWEAPARYLPPGRSRAVLNLMGTTFALETMLRLRVADRAEGGLQAAMVRYGWPELADLPYNKATGFDAVRLVAGRESRRARRVWHRTRNAVRLAAKPN